MSKILVIRANYGIPSSEIPNGATEIGIMLVQISSYILEKSLLFKEWMHYISDVSIPKSLSTAVTPSVILVCACREWFVISIKKKPWFTWFDDKVNCSGIHFSKLVVGSVEPMELMLTKPQWIGMKIEPKTYLLVLCCYCELVQWLLIFETPEFQPNFC